MNEWIDAHESYAGRCAKISAQSACYAGHVDNNMFFFQSGGMLNTNLTILPYTDGYLTYFPNLTYLNWFTSPRGLRARET